MHLQWNLRRLGALVVGLALYAAPALAQDADEIAAPAPEDAQPVEAGVEPAAEPKPAEVAVDEGTKIVLAAVERLQVFTADVSKAQLGELKAVREAVAGQERLLNHIGVCLNGTCAASRVPEGVASANAKLDVMLGGDEGSPGLSDIYAAADLASRGGNLTCPNNCSGRGVCSFGRCFASVQGIDDTIGTVTAGVAEVSEALSQQGQLAEINAGTLSSLRDEVAGLQGQISALRTGLDRDEAERARIRLEKRIQGMLAGPPGQFDITTAAADAEVAVRLVGEQVEAFAAVRRRLAARADAAAAQGGRRAAQRIAGLLADFDRSFAQAAALHGAAAERLGAGDGLGAFLAAKGTGNPLHQCAQITIQVDLAELADVDFD